MMGMIEKMNMASLPLYAADYLKHLSGLLGRLDLAAVEKIGEIFLAARASGNTIYFAGNGGSAATASHFSQDLCEVGRKVACRTFKGVSLTDNTPFITAVGNDYGFEKIFSVQLQEVVNPQDVLVVISASGNSRNLLEAVRFVNDRGGITVGLLGFDGGELLKICQYCVPVFSEKGEFGPVEDVHMILDHLITTYLYRRLKAEGEAMGPIGRGKEPA